MKREWLVSHRMKKKLTQQEVANKTDISESTYRSYELGCRLPSVKNAKKIGNVLKFDWRKFYENE